MREEPVMCIMKGTSELCSKDCPMYNTCWNKEEMTRKLEKKIEKHP